MVPAFPSAKHAVRFAALLFVLLALPPALAAVGLPRRSEVYKAVPLSAGPFPFVEREICEETSDIDIAFVSDSLTWVGVDAPYVQQKLSDALGRPARVVVLGANWAGMDLRYVLLRDLIARRRVKLIVLSVPTPRNDSDRPHILAFRWLLYGEDAAVSDGLPAKGQLAIYAANVLGAPRQLLSRVRANLVFDKDRTSDTLGSKRVEQGYFGAPFARHVYDAPRIEADSLILSERTASRFRFTGPPTYPYQAHFLRQIGRVATEHQAAIAVLHIPTAAERGMDVVPEQARWSDALGLDDAVIGVPSAQLFAGMSEEEFYSCYYDDHLNVNGSELFTKTITAALVKIYVDHQG